MLFAFIMGSVFSYVAGEYAWAFMKAYRRLRKQESEQATFDKEQENAPNWSGQCR